MSRHQLPRVCSISSTMSQQIGIIVAIEFCNPFETGTVKCHDIEKNVATFFLVHLFNLCRDNENMCRDISLPFQIESNINYFRTYRKHIATFY